MTAGEHGQRHALRLSRVRTSSLSMKSSITLIDVAVDGLAGASQHRTPMHPGTGEEGHRGRHAEPAVDASEDGQSPQSTDPVQEQRVPGRCMSRSALGGATDMINMSSAGNTTAPAPVVIHEHDHQNGEVGRPRPRPAGSATMTRAHLVDERDQLDRIHLKQPLAVPAVEQQHRDPGHRRPGEEEPRAPGPIPHCSSR